MGWNSLSDPDMRTANFKFSCDVYREGVYRSIYLSMIDIINTYIMYRFYTYYKYIIIIYSD